MLSDFIHLFFLYIAFHRLKRNDISTDYGQNLIAHEKFQVNLKFH